MLQMVDSCAFSFKARGNFGSVAISIEMSLKLQRLPRRHGHHDTIDSDQKGRTMLMFAFLISDDKIVSLLSSIKSP